MLTLCPPGSDRAFGPQVETRCRSFDFTIYFEDLFFACLPSVLFVLFLPTPVTLLLWRKAAVVKHSSLLASKLSVLLALFILELVFLALRVRSAVSQTNASKAADIVGLVAAGGAVILSYLDHTRSIRPSTLLAIYLSISTLLDIARVRTFWLIPSATGEAVVLTVILVLTFSALLLESAGKTSSVKHKGQDTTPEQFSGFWKRTTFAWLAGTFRDGFSKILSVDDLPPIDPQVKSHLLRKKLESTWARYDKHKRHSLLRACFRAFAGCFMSAVIPRLCVTGFSFAQPFLINTTINFVGSSNPDIDSGKALIGAYALAYAGLAASTALYWYQTFQFLISLRGGLISLIYKQTVRARAVDLGDFSAITLMGTDAERIITGFRSIHEVWGSLIDIGVAVWLLERQVFVACIVPAVIVSAFILATLQLSSRSKVSQRLWIEKVEVRLRITSSMLGDMKAVKMLGLTHAMSTIIQGLRKAEIETSRTFRKMLIWQIFLSNSPADLAPVATFAVFVIIAITKKDTSLLTAQAFTSLSLISLLTSPVLTFIQAVPALIQCIGCFDRIQEYCSVPIYPPTSITSGHSDGLSIGLQTLAREGSQFPQSPGKHLISFNGQSFGWSKTNKHVLNELDINIERNLITMIVGPVGSGKSAFLESLLGETISTPGLTGKPPFTAYCAQLPWLTNDTIRKNILGASDIDEDWYRFVLWACGLEVDLAQMQRGDKTMVGSNAVNLSGGQKQRIALARAIFSRSNVVLLDDVFSGIDSHTIDLICRRLFGRDGYFRRSFTTVVLATHTQKLLPFADIIIALSDGSIIESGSLEKLNSANGYVSSLRIIPSPNPTTELYNPSLVEGDLHSPEAELIVNSALSDLKRQNGDISVYTYYLEVAGRRPVFLFLVFMMIWTFCAEFPTVWLKWWSDANSAQPNHDVGLYIGIYTFFGLFGTANMTAACWFLFINIISNSALRLHGNLLESILKAPFRFFHTVDVGSITNRFSQDMELIDMDLPLTVINYISAVCTCLVKMVILVAFAKYLAVTIPFVAVLIFLLQKFYLRTSRQIRLLDIEAKAPLYTQFLESVNGAITIRAFRWQNTFEQQSYRLIDRSQRPVYLLYCIQQWLALVLDLLVATLAVILVAIVVTWTDKFSPGSVGVSLVIVMTFNKTLTSLIKFWTQMETSIGAVARVKAFVATTESEERPRQSNTGSIAKDWPNAGAIEFSSVVAAHSSGSSPILKGISMSVKAGEKIAVCGRSGSGKTSLILCLLQMIDLQDGSISVDGVDVFSLPCSVVRSRINVVPQEPFIMPGTIRFNIDPFGQVPDADIVKALERVRLWNVIQTEGGLEMEVSSGSWSTGQKQLLCMARALLRKGKVLVLDEATSSDTETVLQEIIETDFGAHTVLAVMHRLKYISRYDRVALLDDGIVIEFDDPAKLITSKSRFADLYNSKGQGDI